MRNGYRIFDADTHIIEPVEPIEQYLSAADKARLAARTDIGRPPGKGGMSRYRIGKMPKLNRRLGSREYVERKRREWGWRTLDEQAAGAPAEPPTPPDDGGMPIPKPAVLETLEDIGDRRR